MSEGDEPGTQATVLSRPARSADHTELSPEPTFVSTLSGAPTAGPTAGGSTTIQSPAEALERDELLRTRLFCLIGTVVSLAGTGAAALLPGNPTATLVLVVAVGCALAAVLFLYVRTGDVEQYRRPSTLIGWYIPAVCINSAIPFFGVWSPAPVVLVLGIYFTGLGRSTLLSIAAYLTCAGAQGILAAMVITGTIRDTGIIQIAPVDHYEQWLVQGLVQLGLLAAHVIARVSRTTALEAHGELERAVRTTAHREALLLEAREELERALRPGSGRFTGQALGSYRLGDVLGTGGMGEVYEGVTASGQQVAIKVLSQASLGSPELVKRFMRELRTAASIASAHVVRVIDVGETPVPYLVMEKLIGKTLADRLRDPGLMSRSEVVEMLRQLGEGIAAAGAAGVVHRDLKPQNVFLDRQTWKVLDFGIARALDGGETLSAGQVIGTPSYMAPEQAAGALVDHRADLYALAAIAYRALTGQPPFVPGELAETLYRVVHGSPRRPSDLADLPSDVDLALAIGLAKRPDDRFASAGELADAIAAALASDLAPALRTRGNALVRASAWVSARPRRATARLRGPVRGGQ